MVQKDIKSISRSVLVFIHLPLSEVYRMIFEGCFFGVVRKFQCVP